MHDVVLIPEVWGRELGKRLSSGVAARAPGCCWLWGDTYPATTGYALLVVVLYCATVRSSRGLLR